jgi:hypothetical protein
MRMKTMRKSGELEKGETLSLIESLISASLNQARKWCITLTSRHQMKRQVMRKKKNWTTLLMSVLEP